MYSTYRYKVTVYNDVGQLTSEPTADVTTFGGFPRRSADVVAAAISHLEIGVSWITPGSDNFTRKKKHITILVDELTDPG